MLIERKIELDYGHTLPNHYSFCNQIHGHRGVVIAGVEGKVNRIHGDSSEGMLLDFKILDKIMMDNIHGILDHGFAVWEEDKIDKAFIIKRNSKYLITPLPPTAEYLAEWAFNQIEKKLPEELKLKYIKWWETSNSMAMYEK